MPTRFRGALAVVVIASLSLSALAAIPRPARAFNVTVTVLAPVGGENWSAGSVRELRYTIESDSGNPGLLARIAYASDNGSGTVADPAPGANNGITGGYNAYNWTLPAADLANVTVTVCAHDPSDPDTCGTSAAFRIDGTRPVVTANGPTGTNVRLDATVEVHFSEPIDARFKGPAAVSIVPSAGPLTVAGVANNGWAIGHEPFLAGTTYVVRIGCVATDESDPGNALAGCPFSWSFTTDFPPSIALTAPSGGEAWTGGSTHAVAWTASDAEDATDALNVTLDSSLDGGSTWSPLAGPLPGSASYAWAVPTMDVPNARLRARVDDTGGLTATATSASFAIDGTPPTVASTVPADAATGVGWSDPITVAFSEPVLGPASRATFGLRDASGQWVRGTVAWISPTQLRFAPAAPYRADTLYTAYVNATLRDRSNPGNPFASYAWSFLTRPNVLPSVQLQSTIAPVVSGGSPWTVAWDASDADDPAGLLDVYVEYSDGGPFVMLGGPLGARPPSRGRRRPRTWRPRSSGSASSTARAGTRRTRARSRSTRRRRRSPPDSRCRTPRTCRRTRPS